MTVVFIESQWQREQNIGENFMKRGYGFLIICLVSGVCYISESYGKANPVLTSIQPKSAQRGQEIEVTLSGTDLEGAREILLNRDEIQAQIVSWEQRHGTVQFNGEGIRAHLPGGQQIMVRLTLPATASPDALQLRVQTPHGVSNPVSFYVDDLPQMVETEPNDSAGEANPVDMPATINGVISSEDDEDHYVIEAVQGQRIIVDVQASRIGSPLNSYLVLEDAQGKQVARNVMEKSLDSLLDYTVEVSGKYHLVIRDLRYQGGNDYFYRIRVGVLPYLDSIFPLGGSRGKDSKVAIQGRNIEEFEDFQVGVGADTPLGIRTLRVTSASGFSSNALAFQVSDLPEYTEEEPDSELKQAETVSPPVNINGRIAEPEDSDTYTFQANSGQRLIFEVFAQRLGSPLDCLLQLSDEQGTLLKFSDDAAGSDARLEFTFDRKGRYFISIREINRGGRPDAAYRLSIRTPQPDFSVRVSPDNPRVYAGNSVPLSLNLNAVDGFSGPLLLHLEDVPDSFRLEPYSLLPMRNSSLVTLHVPQETKAGLYRIRLAAESMVDGQSVIRVVQPETIYLTVMDQAPFSLDIVDMSARLVQGKSTTLTVRANRSEQFQTPIQLEVEGLPNGVSASSVALAPEQETVEIRLNASGNAEVGDFAITVRGNASHQAEPVESAATAIPLEVDEAPFILDVEPKRLSLPLVVKSGGESISAETVTDATPEVGFTEEVEIKVSIERKGYFSDTVQLVPQNVPEGIELTVPEIPAGENEAVVKLAGRVSLKPDSYSIRFKGVTTVNSKNFEQNAPGVEVKFIPVEITAGTQ